MIIFAGLTREELILWTSKHRANLNYVGLDEWVISWVSQYKNPRLQLLIATDVVTAFEKAIETEKLYSETLPLLERE